MTGRTGIAILGATGSIGRQALDVIKAFEETGRTTPIGPAVDRNRARFGLPPMQPVPMEEIRAILEPDSSEGGNP